MKNFTFLLCLLLGLTSCDSDDDSPNCQGIDCLPEATQTGAGTFGCLVNGEPFYAFGSVDCQYQLVNGEYFFGVGFNRNCCDPYFIDIGSNASSLSQGESYQLTTTDTGNKFAEIGVLDSSGALIFLNTNENYSGNLTITKLDQQNKIVSGTFEFEILNPDDGQVYQITDGRFDSFYAQ